MLTAMLLILMPLAGLLYLISTQPWATFLIPFALLLLFFSVYTLHGVVIHSHPPLSSIKYSFQVAWENAGITLVLWILLVCVWISFGGLPLVGWFIIWLFLPLWAVMLSVTYMDRTGDLQK